MKPYRRTQLADNLALLLVIAFVVIIFALMAKLFIWIVGL